MSLLTCKNETAEDLLACIACLATNRKLNSLHNYHLSEAYKNLIGYDESAYNTLPQYVCHYCITLLLKFNTFRDQCHQARTFLEDARLRKRTITIDLINNFQPHSQLKRSETKIISITENDTADYEIPANSLKIDPNEDQIDIYDDFNQEYAYLSPENSNNDHKIYTDIVKIELKDNNEILTEFKPSKVSKKKNFSSNLRKKAENGKKGKYFETKENMRDFEEEYGVDIIVLSEEQQMNDVLERKMGFNYLHSPYKCDLCYKGYMDAEILNKHMKSQHDASRGNVVCEFCRFRYKDRRGLNQHLKSHRLKFVCKQCSYVSRTTFNAKEHFKMHGGHLHECRHCGKSYEKLSSHLSHLRIQHPSEFIWCDVCGDAFIGSFGLNAHKKRAHRHLSLPAHCTSCDKRFADTVALALHLSHDCVGVSCVHCGEAFTEVLQLRDHLLEKHKSCKVYTCEKCDKRFSRESLYSAHYRRIHVDSEDKASRKKERPWICEVCGKTLPNKCLLLYHQRNHTGEKPYHCTQCPKSFTMRKLLQSHLRVHTSDRPYLCKLCPKTFKGLSALRAHEHIHTGGQTKILSKRKML